MSSKRFIRFRGKKRKRESHELDISSLLDILVIFLVFLLKSYNSSGIVINVPKGILLPPSKSKTLNNHGIIIQVSKTTIWVDDETVLETDSGFDVNDPVHFDRERHGGRLIIPLYTELMKKKDLIQKVQRYSAQEGKFSGIANLVIDKSITYSFIKRIMYTCAEAGLKQYKFVVLGQEG